MEKRTPLLGDKQKARAKSTLKVLVEQLSIFVSPRKDLGDLDPPAASQQEFLFHYFPLNGESNGLTARPSERLWDSGLHGEPRAFF